MTTPPSPSSLPRVRFGFSPHADSEKHVYALDVTHPAFWEAWKQGGERNTNYRQMMDPTHPDYSAQQNRVAHHKDKFLDDAAVGEEGVLPPPELDIEMIDGKLSASFTDGRSRVVGMSQMMKDGQISNQVIPVEIRTPLDVSQIPFISPLPPELAAEMRAANQVDVPDVDALAAAAREQKYERARTEPDKLLVLMRFGAEGRPVKDMAAALGLTQDQERAAMQEVIGIFAQGREPSDDELREMGERIKAGQNTHPRIKDADPGSKTHKR